MFSLPYGKEPKVSDGTRAEPSDFLIDWIAHFTPSRKNSEKPSGIPPGKK
jgi:hypothetical protein